MAVDSERGAELRPPDFVEPVVGWRVWLVVDRAGEVRLRSVVYPTLWEPRVETVAECVHLKRHPPQVGFSNHSAPWSRCDCGIYAARELVDGVHYLRASDAPGADVLGRVFGRVSLWGSVVESERGWRGSHAYPAHLVIAQLLHLESDDPEKDISIYINSPGGDVYAGLAIYDTMQFVKPDVSTICVGMAMSMGALLLGAGTKGKRMALPNSKIMIHQVWSPGGAGGQATDIEIRARELINVKRRMEEIIAEHTGQPYDRVSRDMERDYFLSAQEAEDYGIIDRVI